MENVNFEKLLNKKACYFGDTYLIYNVSNGLQKKYMENIQDCNDEAKITALDLGLLIDKGHLTILE